MAAAYPPDLTVILCFRTFLSLFGLLFLIAGIWFMEKQWDDQGAQAYQRAKDNGGGGDYQAPDNEDKKPDVESNDYQPAPDGTTTTPEQEQEPAVTASPDELFAALPLPKPLVAGFGLWALSFIFTANQGFGFNISGWSLTSVLLVVAIGYIVVFPMRKAAWTRNVVLKKQSTLNVMVLTTSLAITGKADNSLSLWFLSIIGGKKIHSGYGVGVFRISTTQFLTRARVNVSMLQFSSFSPVIESCGNKEPWGPLGIWRANPILDWWFKILEACS